MRIGELAERTGTTVRMLRYYEEQGLLWPARDGLGNRSYGEDALAVVQQIRSLLTAGFALAETRPFVECLRAGNTAGDVCPDSRAMYRHRLAELDAGIDRMLQVRADLSARLAAVSSLTGPPAPRCAATVDR